MRFIFFNLLTILSCITICNAQSSWSDIDLNNAVSVDTMVRQGYTLVFVNKDSTFDSKVRQRMIDAFFTVYPKEVKMYNPASIKKVVMIIDPAYTGVAATDNGIIRVNPQWMHKHPEDIDVVTHEVMHIVQSYPDDAGPGWVTEGIADYVRYQFGVNNDAAPWSLPPFNVKQSYEDAYRVTARFFAWIEKHHTKGTVKKLDMAMRTKTYSDVFWKKTTGKTVDELWKLYAMNPVI